MTQTISVIIPVKNEGEKLGNCLTSVFSQTTKPLEVIVVDGHSSDNTIDVAKKFPVKVYFEDYRTRAGANQIGVENSCGDYIAFTDADCIPDTNWLKNLVCEFTPDIVGVGGAVHNKGDGLWEESIIFISNTFLGSANSIQGRIYDDKRFVGSISGCNCMYRRSDILRCGGFNVRLGTAEDTDLNHRISKFGKLLYTPNAVIDHRPKRGLKEFGKRMQQYGYGRAKSKLFDIQILPPVIFVVLALLGILTLWPMIVAIFVYVCMILLMGAYASIKWGKIWFIFSVPIVYFIEHVCYSIGLFKGSLSVLADG